MDDLECQINPLFNALNCETLSKPVVKQLLVLMRGKPLYKSRKYCTISFNLAGPVMRDAAAEIIVLAAC